MLSDETRAVHALHQSGRGEWVVRGDHAHVAPRLLHHYAENEPTVYMIFPSTGVDCGLDVLDIGLGIWSQMQGR